MDPQNLRDPAELLQEWCRSLESGDPERIASFYDAKATVAFRRNLLQGRTELEDLLQCQRRKLRHLQIASTNVDHASEQRLRFTLTVSGPFGRITVENDWTVMDGRIRDHSFHITTQERDGLTAAS